MLRDSFEPLPKLLVDPKAAARAAKLRYTNPDEPGLARKKRGRGFVYLYPDGRPIRRPDVLARIRKLAVPPAWTDVWICPTPDGHIQATGRDARGRKQYRYHERWRAVRDAAKFEHLLEFAECLPALRRRVDADLRRRGLPREKVLAAVVRLLDLGLLRVGNEEYARQNNSFGLTTLENRHAAISGSTIELVFRGKAGVHRRMELSDRRLAQVVRRCQELPGQKLFAYVEDDGQTIRGVESGDVNDYLREATGRDVTSKHFRTWGATVAAALALHCAGPRHGKAKLQRCVTRAVEHTSDLLGNTPAVCRGSYIHPSIISSYLDGTLCAALDRVREPRSRTRGLDREERMVLGFLRGLARRSRVSALNGGGSARQRRRRASR